MQPFLHNFPVQFQSSQLMIHPHRYLTSCNQLQNPPVEMFKFGSFFDYLQLSSTCSNGSTYQDCTDQFESVVFGTQFKHLHILSTKIPTHLMLNIRFDLFYFFHNHIFIIFSNVSWLFVVRLTRYSIQSLQFLPVESKQIKICKSFQ